MRLRAQAYWRRRQREAGLPPPGCSPSNVISGASGYAVNVRLSPRHPFLRTSIGKGIPTAGLLALTLVSKFGDHLPLYRQERIYARAGLAILQSTLGAWVGICGVRLQPLVDALQAEVLTQNVLHADETPVQKLSPGDGKTHRAYLWAYAPSQLSSLRAVIYQFAPRRSGEHACAFLQGWQGKLVSDDFSGQLRRRHRRDRVHGTRTS